MKKTRYINEAMIKAARAEGLITLQEESEMLKVYFKRPISLRRKGKVSNAVALKESAASYLS